MPIIYHPEFNRAKFAILASRLDKALGNTDDIYLNICRNAGTEVGKLTIRTVEKSGLDISPLPVFFSGGVLLFNRHAQKAFEETLRDRFQIMLSQPRLPTVLGSTILALREAGVEITDELVAQLASTYRNVDELTRD